MKNIYSPKSWTCCINIKVLVLVLFLSMTSQVFAQGTVVKPFTSRYPVERIRGDFTLIGNKNLSLTTYDENGNNGLQGGVSYVNVAPGTGIINSSTANLVFSNEGGQANPANSEVKFAGLY